MFLLLVSLVSEFGLMTSLVELGFGKIASRRMDLLLVVKITKGLT